jgi:hypothetical protein
VCTQSDTSFNLDQLVMDHKIMRSIYQYLILVRVCVCNRERERVLVVNVRLRRARGGEEGVVQRSVTCTQAGLLAGVVVFFPFQHFIYMHTRTVWTGAKRSRVKEVRNGHGIKISIARVHCTTHNTHTKRERERERGD